VAVLDGVVQEQRVDVVVSAVSGGLVSTDGVSGSLLAAGGDGLRDELDRLIDQRRGRPLPAGQVEASAGGNLPVGAVVLPLPAR
jgi:O-acetyl-ADP-ribose deacetylase (regulator of RNase III)